MAAYSFEIILGQKMLGLLLGFLVVLDRMAELAVPTQKNHLAML
jgi:hypothetical protein